MVMNTEFSIVDVETTGLSANGADRIIEIAVVRVDARGRVLDDFVTLVNPRRSVGPTFIHGIQNSDVKHAPFFEEIAGDVAARLAGAVFVAHNASFDLRFLRAEMVRAGYALPAFPYLCTMLLSRRTTPSACCHKLEVLCNRYGIDNSRAHSALDDARATARLLDLLIDKQGQREQLSLAQLGVKGERLAKSQWPALQPSGKVCCRA